MAEKTPWGRQIVGVKAKRVGGEVNGPYKPADRPAHE